MLFKYKAITKDKDEARSGTIEALSADEAIQALQGRNLTIVTIAPAGGEKKSILELELFTIDHVSMRDVVFMSRQVATLFAAHVSALRAFTMLAQEAKNPFLRVSLEMVVKDIQGGVSISGALAKHPKVFSNFYVNMVASGEESGTLSETFEYLADYLERSYELTVKTRNAFIYPSFVIGVFIVVMILLLTLVFPKLAQILTETGQELPIYTRIIIGVSDFLREFGILLLVLLIVGALFLWRYRQSVAGRETLSQIKLNIPIFGKLFRKIYLARIADNLNTMLVSGISMVRALEISASVVNDATYEDILKDAARGVRGGSSVSAMFTGHEEIPGIMVQIIRIGEETGETGKILETLARFYKREVDAAVDTLVDLIQPILIVALGLGVGTILAAVLVPIYNLSSGF